MTFKSLNLIEPILKSLEKIGYTTPTPIQQSAIPIVLANEDLLACAQTGTGKTAAFAIPILQLLHNTHKETKGKRQIRALIVTPTRELAIQIEENFNDYGKYTNLKNTVIFGGVNQRPQTEKLMDGVDILVATPGRLLDLINQKYISLSYLEIFVLDEADRMLDMGFVNDVRKLLKLIPAQRQSLFFSATMPKEIMVLADTILKNPKKVEITPASTTAETINQSVYLVDKTNKNALLLHILDNKKIETMLVFTRTKHGANKVVKVLETKGIKAEAIHGNKSQNARQNALQNFKDKTTRVLVATDIAARGIDVDSLAYVLNFELPNIPETYVHRIGRTGRAGADGTAFSFCDHEELSYLRDIQKLIGLKIPVVQDNPFPMGNEPIQKAEEPRDQRGSGHQKPNTPKPINNKLTKKKWFNNPKKNS